jgi:hypothetical protein
LIILLIPLCSLASRLTFFRKKRSYLEHLIAMIYLFSTWIILFVIADLIQKYVLLNVIDEGMFLSFMIVLFVWTARLHAPGTKWYQVAGFTAIQAIILIMVVSCIIGIFYLFLPGSINTTSSIIHGSAVHA